MRVLAVGEPICSAIPIFLCERSYSHDTLGASLAEHFLLTPLPLTPFEVSSIVMTADEVAPASEKSTNTL